MGSDNRRTIRLEPAPLKSDTLGLCSGRPDREPDVMLNSLPKFWELTRSLTHEVERSALKDEGDARVMFDRTQRVKEKLLVVVTFPMGKVSILNTF